MQYESNLANGFRDIVWKRKTDAQTHGQKWLGENPPPLLRGRGIKIMFTQSLSDPSPAYFQSTSEWCPP